MLFFALISWVTTFCCYLSKIISKSRHSWVNISPALPTSAGEDCAVKESDCCHCFTQWLQISLNKCFLRKLLCYGHLQCSAALFKLIHVGFNWSILPEIIKLCVIVLGLSSTRGKKVFCNGAQDQGAHKESHFQLKMFGRGSCKTFLPWASEKLLTALNRTCVTVQYRIMKIHLD